MSERKYTAAGARLRAGFTALPNLVLRDAALTATARLLYATMLDLAWREEEPEQAELAAMLGVSEKPLRKFIRELELAGLVQVRRRGQGKTNAYVLNEPGDFQNGSNARTGTGATPDPSLKDLEQDGEAEAKASTSRPGEVSTRKRNVVYDALVTATNANPADGGKIGKAAKDIREAMEPALALRRQTFLAANPSYDEVPAEAVDKVIATEIYTRAAMYAERRPEWELTPTALATHWNRIPTWKKRGGKMTAADIARVEG